MKSEIIEPPTAAELELETSLKQLRDAIARVPTVEQGDLLPVQESLVTLNDAMVAEDPRCFVQALVGLARTVIDMRKAAQRGPLAALPVPPYDLWLPFKALSLRASDQPSSRYTAAGAVRNKRIASELSALLELLKRLEPERSDPQKAAGNDKEA
jgi:hypothetical protein